MQNKEFTIHHHLNSSVADSTVILNGVLDTEPLTPVLAARAARVAQGHASGVTVWSDDDYGYRLYENSARKVWKW